MLVGARREIQVINNAKVAELADALGLGPSPERGGGSSPPFRTNSFNEIIFDNRKDARSAHSKRAGAGFKFYEDRSG